jgi:hypothetical protein
LGWGVAGHDRETLQSSCARKVWERRKSLELGNLSLEPCG